MGDVKSNKEQSSSHNQGTKRGFIFADEVNIYNLVLSFSEFMLLIQVK